MLRQHGLTGTGGGSEDALLEICWSHFFGSSHPSMFNFLCRNTKKRAAKYADGCGSKTLDGWVKKRSWGWVDAAGFEQIGTRLGLGHRTPGVKEPRMEQGIGTAPSF